MKRFFAFLLLLSAFSYGELGVRIAEGTPRQFFLGERAFVSVYIDGVSGNGSSEGHQGTYPYSLSNLSGNAPWLLPSGRPDFDSGLDNARDHWQNNQNFWLELSGQAPSAGEYSGVFRVTNSATGEFADVPYAFTVSGPPAADSGIAVMMRDPAASYGRQMEIYTSLKNVGMVRKTLQSPYVDYYGTRKGGNQSVVKVWGRPSSSCLQVLDCGNGNFVIRHRFLSSVTLDAGKGFAESGFRSPAVHRKYDSSQCPSGIDLHSGCALQLIPHLFGASDCGDYASRSGTRRSRCGARHDTCAGDGADCRLPLYPVEESDSAASQR